MTPPASVVPSEWLAPAGWTAIDFISDLHLSEETPRTFEAFSKYMLDTTAHAVVILGDLFEAWVGDDSRQSGMLASCTRVLAEAGTRRAVAFMHGNRDFLVGDDMRSACHMKELHDPTVLAAFGQRVMLSHGDDLCIDDVDYQRFRTMVRNPAWQQAFLALPLPVRLEKARQLRTESELRKGDMGAMETWVDIDAPLAVQRMQQASAPVLIHGHTHRPQTAPLAPGFERHVLTDWDMEATPPRAGVLRWTQEGFFRLTLEAAQASH